MARKLHDSGCGNAFDFGGDINHKASASVEQTFGIYTPRNRAERREGKKNAQSSRLKRLREGTRRHRDSPRPAAHFEVDLEEKPTAPDTMQPRRKSRVVERGYERDHKLVDLAKQRADYRCEVEGCTVELFTKPCGQRYVEVHHLIMMAEGGPDTLENVVCVCANHHRELHYGNRRGELKIQLQLLRTEGMAKG